MGMGSGRRKASARRGPVFDADQAADHHLRVTPEAGAPAPSEPKRRAARARAGPSAANDASPWARRPRARARAPPGRRRKRGGRGGGRRRSPLSRLFYWTLVLGLWGLIATAGAIAW